MAQYQHIIYNQFYQPNQNPLPHKNISKTKQSQSQIYYIINKQKKHTNPFLFIKHLYNFKQKNPNCNHVLFTFMHLADAFIKSDLQCIQALNIFFATIYVPRKSNTTLLNCWHNTIPLSNRNIFFLMNIKLNFMKNTNISNKYKKVFA